MDTLGRPPSGDVLQWVWDGLRHWLLLFAVVKVVDAASRGRVSRWLARRRVALGLGYGGWWCPGSRLVRAEMKWKQEDTAGNERGRQSLPRRWRARGWHAWLTLGTLVVVVGMAAVTALLACSVASWASAQWWHRRVTALSPRGSNLWADGALPLPPAALPAAPPRRPLPARLPPAQDLQAIAPASRRHYLRSRVSSSLMATPAADWPIWWTAILVAGAVHEAGHALAALAEGVRIVSVGFFVVFLFPGAYVRLCAQGLARLPPWRQLKIHAAGCLHSFALAAVALLMLGWLPTLFTSAGYRYIGGHGVAVTHVRPDSPLHAHLGRGAVITHLNGNAVGDARHFSQAVQAISAAQLAARRAMCTASAAAAAAAAADDTWQCSVVVAADTAAVSMKPHAIASTVSPSSSMTLELAPATALDGGSDADHRDTSIETALSVEMAVRPMPTSPPSSSLPGEAHAVALYQFATPALLDDISVSDHICLARRALLPRYVLTVVEKFFAYLFLVSFGLGVVNLVPAVFLDGASVASLCVRLLCQAAGADRLSARMVQRVSRLVVGVMTALLIVFAHLTFSWPPR